MINFDEIQRKNAAALCAMQFGTPVIMLALGLAKGLDQVFLITGLSALLAAASWGLFKAQGSTLSSRLLIATSYMLQPALLVLMFSGHAWQVDMHMYFFAALAITSALFDWRAIVAAAGVAALHHLVLTVAVPAWVFPENASILRVMVHAVIVVIETAVLVWLAKTTENAIRQSVAATLESSRKAKDAELATAKANEARNVADAMAAKSNEEAARAQRAEHQAATALQQSARDTQNAKAAEAAAIQAQHKVEASSKEQATIVTALAGALSRLAQGDLTVSINEPFNAEYDSLRSDFNSSVSTLNGLVKQIDTQVSAISRSANELHGATTDLATRTENQASSLAETAATISDIHKSVQNNSSNVSEAQSAAGQAASHANTSSELMGQTVTRIQEIEASSKQVAQINGVIDEIAFQTNLLALNAGVEAARAGEAGRGFTVVAQEVRALAHRATDSAREIDSLIRESQSLVASGAKQINETGEAFQTINDIVNNFKRMLMEITTSSQSQEVALDEINKAIQHLDHITQQNAAMVQETTVSASMIQSGMTELGTMLGRFKIDNGLGSSRAA